MNNNKAAISPDLYKAFFDTLAQNDLSALVQTAWEYFGKPIMITDNNFKTIELFPNKHIGDEVWDEIVDKRMLSFELTTRFLASLTSPAHRKSAGTQGNSTLSGAGKAFRVSSGLADKCPRLICPISVSGHPVAFAAVFLQEREIREGDHEVLELLSKCIYINLSNKGPTTAPLSRAFNDLLKNSSATVSQFAANAISSQYSGSYCILAGVFNIEDKKADCAQYAVDNLSRFSSNLIATVYENIAVVLFCGISGGGLDAKSYDRCYQAAMHLAKFGARCAVSSIFEELGSAHVYFEQARLTAEIGKKPLNLYEENAPTQLFAALCKHYSPAAFIDRVLDEMLKYDCENNTRYYETLYTYCLSFCNRDKCAEKLHVHRNTLLYRLNKIEEKFKIPVNDESRLLSLSISFLFKDFISEKALEQE